MDSVVMRVPGGLASDFRKAIAKYNRQRRISDRKIAKQIGKELLQKVA